MYIRCRHVPFSGQIEPATAPVKYIRHAHETMTMTVLQLHPMDQLPIAMCGRLYYVFYRVVVVQAFLLNSHRTELIEFPLRNPTIKSTNNANRKS